MLQKGLSIRNEVYGLLRRVFGKILYFLGYTLILPLSYCIPKNRQRVLFTTRFGDFEGNVKYLYLYVQQLEEQPWDFFFLTTKKEVYTRLKEENLPVYFYPRLSTCWKMLRTSLIIVDGNEWTRYFKFFFLWKAKKVQLWHGTGLKSIGLLKPSIKTLSPFRKIFKKESILYDLLLFTSTYQLEKRREAFYFKKYLIHGYPRNDILFESTLGRENHMGCDRETIKRAREWKYRGLSLLLYAPTWRKSINTFHHLDLRELDSFAQSLKIVFIFKLHYKQEYQLNLESYTNIFEYNTTADIYPLLSYVQLLITDYSSIYLDYLLLHRPILFYPYDKEEYIEKERELLLDYDDVTPGPQSLNQKDLQDSIYLHLVKKEDPYRQEREALRDRFFKYHDGTSREGVWKTIRDELLLAKTTREQDLS